MWGWDLPGGCSSLTPRSIELAERQLRSTFWAWEGLARAGVCQEAPRPLEGPGVSCTFRAQEGLGLGNRAGAILVAASGPRTAEAPSRGCSQALRICLAIRAESGGSSRRVAGGSGLVNGRAGSWEGWGHSGSSIPEALLLAPGRGAGSGLQIHVVGEGVPPRWSWVCWACVRIPEPREPGRDGFVLQILMVGRGLCSGGCPR